MLFKPVYEIIDQKHCWFQLIPDKKNKLRVDNKPGSVKFFESNGLLLMKDFSTGKCYDLVGYVKELYTLSYHEACEYLVKINGNIKTKYHKVTSGKSKMSIVPEKWNSDNLDYWNRKGVTDLKLVIPFRIYKINNICAYSKYQGYAYKIGDRYKLYFPDKPRPRFLCNTSETWYLKRNSDTLLILKGYKEYLMIQHLVSFDIYVLPTESVTKIKINSYKKIYIYLDNDATGIKNSNILKENLAEYSDNIQIIFDPIKDFDEYYKVSPEEAVKFIKSLDSI